MLRWVEQISGVSHAKALTDWCFNPRMESFVSRLLRTGGHMEDETFLELLEIVEGRAWLEEVHQWQGWRGGGGGRDVFDGCTWSLDPYSVSHPLRGELFLLHIPVTVKSAFPWAQNQHNQEQNVHSKARRWKSEDGVSESVLFYHGGPGYWTQVAGLHSRCVYMLSHLPDPCLFPTNQ